MMTWKEVAKLVASDEFKEAWWGRRMGLRLHLLMCSDCRRYAKQLRALGAYARNRWGPQTEDSDTLQRLEREILERPKPKGPPEGLA